MQETLGQNKTVWTEEWKRRSIESEIQMWDFFCLRPWIMKYVPRFGKVIEAGCGLGRYVFLLNRFAIDIEGLDFSDETIHLLNKWKSENKYEVQFKVGDITKLPYEDNSLSGYLSFGVIEHFIEGPQKPLSEVFRTLRPGGIAIITTPSKSWFYYFSRFRLNLKNFIKIIIGRKIVKPAFFQYWYSPKQLKKFVENSGLKVTRYSGTDVLYSFHEFCRLYKIRTENHKWLFSFSQMIEKTYFRNWGAQSVVIAIKPAEKMQCFLCGKLTATYHSLTSFDVPICSEHKSEALSSFYKNTSMNPTFNNPYQIQTPLLHNEERICEITKQNYYIDKLFEDFGLSIHVHPDLLKNPETSIKLSNNYLTPIWRSR